MQWKCTLCLCIAMTAATGLLRRIAPHSVRPAAAAVAAGSRRRKGRQQGRLRDSGGRRCCTWYCCTLLGWCTCHCETTGHSCGGCCGGGLGCGSDCRGVSIPHPFCFGSYHVACDSSRLACSILNIGQQTGVCWGVISVTEVLPQGVAGAPGGRPHAGVHHTGVPKARLPHLTACCTFWACGKGFCCTG